MKPVLHLDIDGVLNAFDGIVLDDPALQKNPWGDSTKTTVIHPGVDVEFTFWYSPTLIEELLELDVEIRWLTTWLGYANTQVAPALFGYNPNYKVSGSFGWSKSVQKLDAIDLFVTENPKHPMIWIDDEMVEDYFAKDHMSKKQYSQSSNLLFIQPNPYIGMTPKDMDDIKLFLKINKTESK